jgi:hypothetical protein
MKEKINELRKANQIAMSKVNLDKLTHQQLIALGKQKTDIPYRELVKIEREKLVAQLSKVKGVMTPVQT